MRALVFALRRLVADQVLVLLAVRDDAVAELPESLRRIVSGHHGAVARAGPRRARAAGAREGAGGRVAPLPGRSAAARRDARQPAARPRGARREPSQAVDRRGEAPAVTALVPAAGRRPLRRLWGRDPRPARRRGRAGRPGGTAARGGRRRGHRVGAGRRRGRAARPAGRGHRAPPLDAGVPPPARPVRPARRTRPGPAHGAAPCRRPARRRRGRGAAPPGRGRPCTRRRARRRPRRVRSPCGGTAGVAECHATPRDVRPAVSGPRGGPPEAARRTDLDAADRRRRDGRDVHRGAARPPAEPAARQRAGHGGDGARRPGRGTGDVRERVEAARCGLPRRRGVRDDRPAERGAPLRPARRRRHRRLVPARPGAHRARRRRGPHRADVPGARSRVPGTRLRCVRGCRGRRRRGGRRGRPGGGLASAPLGAGGPAPGRRRPGRCAGGSRRRREPGL